MSLHQIDQNHIAAGGFDVTAMGTFMKRMQDATRFSDGNAPSYLRTHPVTAERILMGLKKQRSVA